MKLYPCRNEYEQICMPWLENWYEEWEPCKHEFCSRKEITVYNLLHCEYSTIGPSCTDLSFSG
jgi:hypothetical protein